MKTLSRRIDNFNEFAGIFGADAPIPPCGFPCMIHAVVTEIDQQIEFRNSELPVHVGERYWTMSMNGIVEVQVVHISMHDHQTGVVMFEVLAAVAGDPDDKASTKTISFPEGKCPLFRKMDDLLENLKQEATEFSEPRPESRGVAVRGLDLT